MARCCSKRRRAVAMPSVRLGMAAKTRVSAGERSRSRVEVLSEGGEGVVARGEERELCTVVVERLGERHVPGVVGRHVVPQLPHALEVGLDRVAAGEDCGLRGKRLAPLCVRP